MISPSAAASSRTCTLGRVDEQQPAVVRGQRGAAAVGCGDECEHPADLPGAGAARRRCVRGARVQRRDADGVLAGSVVDPHDAVVAERLGQPGPHPGFGEQHARGPVAVGEAVHGAADGDDAGAPGAVGGDGVEPFGRGEPARRPVAARPGQPHVDRLGTGGGGERFQQPQLPGGLEHDAGAVGRGVARVELRLAGGSVVGVPAQVAAVQVDGVEVAPAFVIGQKRDAGAPPGPDEHRRGEVAVELPEDAGELAGGAAVRPQLAARTAAVALPPGHLALQRGAAQHRGHAGAGPGREIGDGSDGQPPRRDRR